MKSYKSISIAILVALSLLHPPWGGVQNCNAQTNTDTQTNTNEQTSTDMQTNNDTQSNTETNAEVAISTNLYRARIVLFSTSTNANGNLVHQRIVTPEFVREGALGMGVTNFGNLALAYNRSNNSLQIVNRTNHDVISTPLSFAGGTSLANPSNTRVVLQNFVFLNSDSVASGLLSATQRLTYGSSGQLRTFGMRGSIFYSFTDGTNSPTICQGGIAVGSLISQQGDRNRELNDDNNANNNGNRGQGNIQGNRNNRNNFSTNVVNRGFGTTNVNQGGFGTTNINSGFGITNNPVIITNANPGFTSNQGFGTGVSQGFTANQGFGTGISQGIAAGINQSLGTTIVQ